MGQPTQPYKRSISGSVGAGVQSLFGNGGRRFYLLVHKVSSKYHKAGESQQIIVDEIELGRDPRCQVRFDETFETVSRRHAAIVKDGENWKLVQLSQTNSTYLNGHKVEKEWYLQNGDEIQLSTNGPKLGFILPEGKKGLVSSIGLTARLNLFRQQALRPYKYALTALSCVLLLCCGVGGYFLYDARKENMELNALVEQTQEQWDKEKETMRESLDSLTSSNASLLADAEARRKMLDSLAASNADLQADAEARKREVNKLKSKVKELSERPVPSVAASNVDNSAIEACLPYVYFVQTIKFDIQLPTGEKVELDCSKEGVPGWSGTGFLLNDGRFVTARHVVEGWYFWKDGSGVNEELMQFNYIVNNGGKVVATFIAVSSSGSQMQFTSDQFRCNRSGDETGTLEDGGRISLAPLDETDYAYLTTSSHTGLSFDSQKSQHLERGTNLTVLGFPLGIGANAINDINPIYGSGIVAAPGLQKGRILTTDTNYEQGNSGGPVFCMESGHLVVIGIVSAGAGRSTGFVVPISVIR